MNSPTTVEMKNSLAATTNLLTVLKLTSRSSRWWSRAKEKEREWERECWERGGCGRWAAEAEGGYSYNSNRATAKQTTKFTRQRCRRRSCSAAGAVAAVVLLLLAAAAAASAAVAVRWRRRKRPMTYGWAMPLPPLFRLGLLLRLFSASTRPERQYGMLIEIGNTFKSYFPFIYV